jgi:F5/8 type C domain
MPDNSMANHIELDSNKWTDTLWVSFALLMVAAAYYPTLVADYVPMDQWRAFRYGLEPGLSGGRFDSCVIGASRYYFFTGRWLVWFGECSEHAAVAQIGDFTSLRGIVLAIVLLSVIAFRSVLKNILDASPATTFLAVMVVLLPGYAFIYYQGLTGMPVLLALLFSLLSFPLASRAFTAEKRSRIFYFDLGASGILFLSACFIYPIFAFAVIPTSFIFSAFRGDYSFSKRIYLCIKLCVFYAVVALTYYITVKLSIALAEYFGKSIYDLKIYRMDITTDPNELIKKLGTIFLELTRSPLSSFLHIPAWISLPILLGPAGIMFYEGRRLDWGRSGSIFATVVYLLSIPVILIASVSPWLLSHFPEAPYYRHMLPIHFFLILSFGILVVRGIEKARTIYGESVSQRIGTALMIGLISVFSVNQISMSQHQVIESSIEINHMRSAYRELVESGKLWKLREIHVVRPELDRSYDGRPIDREFLPATMAHPGHILQMTRAVLREILPSEQLYKINLVDCGFDRECVHMAPTNALVISQSKFGTPLPELHNNHALIDYSLLNKKPNLIKSYRAPNISVSSQHRDYSSAYLLGTLGPNWSAEWAPKYPQWLQFEFSSPEKISLLSIRAQAGKKAFSKRAPKHFIFQASHDGKSWADLIEVKDAGFSSEIAWKNFPFKNETEYTFYRIYILANGGDPSMLTIQQIGLN